MVATAIPARAHHGGRVHLVLPLGIALAELSEGLLGNLHRDAKPSNVLDAAGHKQDDNFKDED